MSTTEFKPRISVITACFNHGYVIWKAIQSVLKQTYPFFELIIIDDASTDETGKAVNEFSDPRIRYHRLKENLGPSGARNHGLKKARGELIAYLDADNTWHPEFLEVMIKAHDEHPDKVVTFCKKNYRLALVDETGREQRVRDEFSRSDDYFDLKRLWHRRIMIDTNSMCHKREEIIELGGWDPDIKFWEDWELTLRISKKYPKGFLYINRALLDYEQKIDLAKAQETFARWEEEEAKVFNKHKDYPMLKGQTWFPPKKGNKSTLGVIEYLREKHK